jgi:hypothetical protein
MREAARVNFSALFDLIRTMPKPIPKEERHRLSVRDLCVGGFIQFDGQTWSIDEMSRYDEYRDEKYRQKTGDITIEFKLTSLNTGETRWLEWGEDDDVVIYVTTGEIRWKDLRDDGNEEVDEDDLGQIVEAEDALFYKRQRFEYDDDWPSKYHRASLTQGDSVHMYEFYCDASGGFLTIEEWADGSYQIFLSREVNPNEIEILVPGR